MWMWHRRTFSILLVLQVCSHTPHTHKQSQAQKGTCARVKFRVGVREQFRISAKVTECARAARHLCYTYVGLVCKRILFYRSLLQKKRPIMHDRTGIYRALLKKRPIKQAYKIGLFYRSLLQKSPIYACSVMHRVYMPLSHVTHVNQSCGRRGTRPPRIYHMCDMYSHIWMSRVSHMNESCHTNE